MQSGTQNVEAWLFGSLDAGNVITVDKPPAALRVGTTFARIFGFSSFTALARRRSWASRPSACSTSPSAAAVAPSPASSPAPASR
ncbi:hypothetical protein AB0F91_23245 [Amycolatopsis sp. NPDC023774]|uniref:hypothetical protein n=1 Tax=Amycolatopsis sp. NPDC023774 TaxID=3155015 RepID=UPI0033F319DC